jgi:uncharacterized protein (DUF1697 family)
VPTYVALLRAVNVGGRFYKMADLRSHLSDSGLTEVETHIQSGNVRFGTPMRSVARVEQHVERVLGEHCGFEVPAVVLTPEELRTAHGDAVALPTPPFWRVGEGSHRRYVVFFKEADVPTGPVAEEMTAWADPAESAAVVGRCVHVWLGRPTQDAVFLKRFRKPLAPGTSRNLDVVAAMVQRWCT